jgi:large subunit ribosomal protein L4
MPTVDVYSTEKKKVGKVDLDDGIFGVEVKEHLFYTVVRQQLANRRQGTHNTKTRTEVRGGGRKPFKQKGTGRARQGTIRANLMRGGGVAMGPKPRDYSYNVPKKVRRAALKAALSRRVEEDAFTAFDAFQLAEIKTSAVVDIMKRFGFEDLLLVLSEKDETVLKSTRNIQGITVLPVAGLNVYDILNHKNLAATSDAIASIQQRLGS